MPASLVATMPILRFSAMLVARHMRSTSVRSLSGFFCRAICTVDTTPLPSGKVYLSTCGLIVVFTADEASSRAIWISLSKWPMLQTIA